jgi:3'-phosphoadenosine 5'-phosphosulfate sulfotransferase (PAPS reductase)/FAD synthetase
MPQLFLFPQATSPALTLLRAGATLVLSVSGGKDSDALCHHLLELRQNEGWSGRVCMVHADLGRAEWHTTADYVAQLAQRKQVELHVVRYTQGDLIDRIWARWQSLKQAGCPWPSAQARYCTSEMKVAPISRWLRQTFPTGQVICALGLRAQESHTRAQKDPFMNRSKCTAPSKGRFVWNWLPLHQWTETQVWAEIRRHGNVFHPAYALSNQRLSCAMCVLGSLNDLLNGAIHNPETYRELCRIEAVTGYSFRPNLWLSDLHPHLLPAETLSAVHAHQRRKPDENRNRSADPLPYAL